jgi:hypothetical protein
MRFDGFDFLNGRCDPMPPANTPCINADLAVMAWSSEHGIYQIGQGTDLESARAIGRLHAGHDDYIHFDAPITILLERNK